MAGARNALAAAAGIAAAMLALVLTPPALAAEWRAWCGAPADAPSLGWHFYCDRAAEDEAPPPEPSVSAPAPETAAARVAAMRARLEEARARAVLDPSPEHVAAYLHLQKDALHRAAVFSDTFRRTVWARPELDYTLTRPVGALAKRLWSDERRTARDTALGRLSERYGLIYLGHAGCGGCKVFGPLLRAFSLRHGLDVLAVSMTGEALEGWPEAVSDEGRAARLGLSGVPLPAVVLFDTETKTVLPVGFGVLAEDQLAERLFVLTRLETGRDY